MNTIASPRAAARLWPADPATGRPLFWGDDQGRVFAGDYPPDAEGLRCGQTTRQRVMTPVDSEFQAQVVTPDTNLLTLGSEFDPDPWAKAERMVEVIDIHTVRVETDAGVWLLPCGYGPRSRQWFVKGEPHRYVSDEEWMQGADKPAS